MENSNKIVVISGFTFSDNNRGTSALSYGAVLFLLEKEKLQIGQSIISFGFSHSFKLLFSPRIAKEEVMINGQLWTHKKIILSFIEQQVIKRLSLFIPLTRIARVVKKAEYVAAINGGDGFSDIYGARTFDSRLPESLVAIRMKRPLILLPQTIGPFASSREFLRGINILKSAHKIFLRDEQFTDILNQKGISYTVTKDLSYYMLPEPVKIKIPLNSIGLNISGLCFFNHYGPLSGRFNNYSKLIEAIISFFQSKGCHIFLIPHSYNYMAPENFNDDLKACKEVFDNLKSKQNVNIIDDNLTPPQLKYIISKMTLFIGTRMHSNFAAIFTNTPVYGLSYSYKFEGAFKYNNIPLDNLSNVLDLQESDIPQITNKILQTYNNIKLCQNQG